MHKLGYALVLAGALGAIPSAAKAQSSVVCESNRGRRETCRVDTRGEVRLVRKLSDAPCVRGRTWGTISGGVWVDDGCRAQFAAYGNRGGSDRWRNGGNRGYDNSWDRGRGRGRVDPRGREPNDGYDTWGHDRNGRYESDRVISGSRAMRQCRAAVQRRIGNRHLDLWMENNSRGTARVGWRARGGESGSCRVERDGDVDVRFERRR